MDPLRTTDSDIDQVFNNDLPWMIGFVIVIGVLFAISHEFVPCCRSKEDFATLTEEDLMETDSEGERRSHGLFRISRVLHDYRPRSRTFSGEISRV